LLRILGLLPPLLISDRALPGRALGLTSPDKLIASAKKAIERSGNVAS
jgi:hypothetical protein